MGWFEEQLKQRNEINDKEFEEAFYQISDSVTGKNISRTIKGERERALGAIGEIINFYDGNMIDCPDTFTNINDELEFICRPNGIMRRSVVLKDKWYKDSFGAYLVTDLTTDEVVALIPSKTSGQLRYFDSEVGKYIKVTKKNADRFDENAICFYKPLPLRQLTALDIVKYGLSVWNLKDIILPIAIMVATLLIGLLTPRLSHFLFQDVFLTQNESFLISTIIFLVCISLSRLLMETVQSIITTKNTIKTSVSVEAAVMMRILALPAGFFKDYSSGEIQQRINYANSICDIFIELIFETGLTSILSLMYIFQMVSYAKSLVLPAICVILLTIIFMLIATAVGVKNNKKLMEASAKENGISYSLITGVQKIKSAGAEKRAFARWAKYYADVSNVSYNLPLILKLNDFIPTAISLIGMVVIYLAATKSNVSVADYYAFETAYGMVLGAFISFAGVADSIANIKPTIEMIKPILDAEPEVSQGKTMITHLSGNIELNNIMFRYSESMPPIFENLNLKIRAGQYVAIVGKTGCGKSTLVRLLLGFEKPKKGAIYYDGKDLDNIDLKSLRRNIGTVMQDGKLFQGDMYSNIVIAAPWLTLDDAWEAAELAGVADDIRNMPMGMQTLVSEGSSGISGGQRQRIMIARAVAPKPKILIFDEATSALDNLTQQIVSDSLDQLKCTRIVIAHRLSTIRHCDRIIFLDDGKIAEDGTYDELIAKNGLFAELVSRQLIEEEDDE